MTRMTEIDGTEKIYDSRDIIARIEKLEAVIEPPRVIRIEQPEG